MEGRITFLQEVPWPTPQFPCYYSPGFGSPATVVHGMKCSACPGRRFGMLPPLRKRKRKRASFFKYAALTATETSRTLCTKSP